MRERTILVAGETLIARADATLFWPAQSTLFVADVHLGKAAAFRSLAVPVPAGTSASALARLGQALDDTSAARLVFLGDLWHARQGRTPAILDSLSAWRASRPGVNMILVEGNHDLRSGSLPPQLGIDTVQEPFGVEPFSLCHHPCEPDGGYALAGHIHPAVSLKGPGRQSLRFPCFWFGRRCAVLPAFGDFTGMADIQPSPDDRILLLAGGELLEAIPASAAS